MAYNLNGLSLLSLKDFSKQEIMFLLDVAFDLKRFKRLANETQHLIGKEIILIFEKASTRTRCAFEIAAFDQGANVTYMGPGTGHMGSKETVKDSARVFGRIYDAIAYRGFGQEIVEDLKKYAGVPVYNALTDEFHPTQMFADAMTMIEHTEKRVRDISYCYLGDARSNMGNSLLLLGSKLGMDVRISAPKSLWPNKAFIDLCKSYAKESKARVELTEDPHAAVKGVDFIYTDVWVSMGETYDKWGERIKELLPYQVNKDLMNRTNNPEVKFMHCLPAFHNTATTVGSDIAKLYPNLKNGIEVTEEVFESDASIVFDQAENRMHSIKAILVATIGNL